MEHGLGAQETGNRSFCPSSRCFSWFLEQWTVDHHCRLPQWQGRWGFFCQGLEETIVDSGVFSILS